MSQSVSGGRAVIDTDGIEDRTGCLSPDQFSFTGYRNPERFFQSPACSYKVVTGTTSCHVLKDVLYVPSTRSYLPFDGCLYDASGVRIDGSCIYRGPRNRCVNLDSFESALPRAGLEIWERPVVYLGYVNKHFGHFLIESLARCWSILGDDAKGIGYLFHVYDPAVLSIGHVDACLSALGVRKSNLIFFRKPTIVKEVVLPNVAFQLDSHVDDIFRSIGQRIAERYRVEGRKRTERPLYVSRRRLASGVTEHVGEEEVEAFLLQTGARVIHPQYLPFQEQVRAFGQHRVILGINGSAMHNLIFSDPGLVSIQFGRSAIPPTFFLIDRCFGVRATYIYGGARNEHLALILDRLSRRTRRWKIARTLRHMLGGRGFLESERLAPARIIRSLKNLGFG